MTNSERQCGTILVLGASGKTGRLLVRELLERGEKVRAIVRSAESLTAELNSHANLSLHIASVLELSDEELAEHASDCKAVACCLGHNLTFRGVFGSPRRLVTEAVRRICTAVRTNEPGRPVRFVLMNTAGNSNRDHHEPISFAQRIVIALFRLLLPPHVDNEQAADYLRCEIGQQNPIIEWAVVRPDDLIDCDHVTEYDLFPSPIRSAIFNAGKTSRINVAHFMAELINDDECWSQWNGQMPVIYNRSQNDA